MLIYNPKQFPTLDRSVFASQLTISHHLILELSYRARIEIVWLGEIDKILFLILLLISS